MGMIITTAATDEEDAPWIFDPATEDDAPFAIEGVSGTILDILEAVGIERGLVSDQSWLLSEIKPRLAEALTSSDPTDDYLTPRLERLAAIIAAGEARGAIFLTAS